MGKHDCTGLISNCGFDLICIDIECGDVYINKHRHHAV